MRTEPLKKLAVNDRAISETFRGGPVRPMKLAENRATGPVSKQNLIHAGHFEAEKLVSMKSHHYRLEPNVTFTPDHRPRDGSKS